MGKHPAGMSVPPGEGANREVPFFSSLEEMRREGFVPFTLGPLYVLGNIDFNIMARFAGETMTDVYLEDHFEIDFEHVIIRLSGKPYDKRMFGLRDSLYAKFSAWLKTHETVNRKDDLYFRPIVVGGALLDPFVKTLNVSAPKPEAIDVWTISSNKGIAVPKTHIEQLPHPVFKEGEAEELREVNREEYLRRLPKPVTAPPAIKLTKKPADPSIVLRGKEVLGEPF
jgi:hypothetical protein